MEPVRPRGRRRPMAEINVVPYIDVMLVMLVIFMVTAPLLNQGVEVDLPVADAEPLPSEQQDPLVVTVDGMGRLYVNVGDDPDQDSVAKTALGHGAAKRAFAFELGVNPYSDFEPLQEELNEVAWTAVGGSLTVSVGFRAIGGTPGTVLSTSKLANGMRKLDKV